MRSILSILVAIVYSTNVTAGTIFDAYKSEDARTATSLIVVKQDGQNVSIQLTGRAEGAETLVIPTYRLNLMAIAEGSEQLKIFAPPVKANGESNLPARLGKAWSSAGVGILFMAPFLGPVTLLVLTAVVIGGVTALEISYPNEVDSNGTTSKPELDKLLLAGSANLILQARTEENVAASRGDKSDVLAGIMANLRQNRDRQDLMLKEIENELPPIHEITRDELEKINRVLSTWDQLFIEEAKSIDLLERGYEKMIRTSFNTNQRDIVAYAKGEHGKLVALLDGKRGLGRDQAHKSFTFLRVLTAGVPEL